MLGSVSSRSIARGSIQNVDKYPRHTWIAHAANITELRKWSKTDTEGDLLPHPAERENGHRFAVLT